MDGLTFNLVGLLARAMDRGDVPESDLRMTPLARALAWPGLLTAEVARHFPPGSFVHDYRLLVGSGICIAAVSMASLLGQAAPVRRLFLLLRANRQPLSRGVLLSLGLLLADDSLRRQWPGGRLGHAWLELAAAGTLLSQPFAVQRLGSWRRWRALMMSYYGAGTAAWLSWAAAAAGRSAGGAGDARTLRSLAVATAILSVHGFGMVFGFPVFSMAAEAFWRRVAIPAWSHLLVPAGTAVAKVVRAVCIGVACVIYGLWSAGMFIHRHVLEPVWERILVPLAHALAGAARHGASLLHTAAVTTWERILSPMWRVVIGGARGTANIGKLVAAAILERILVPLWRKLVEGVCRAADFGASLAVTIWKRILVPLWEVLAGGARCTASFATSTATTTWKRIFVPAWKLLVEGGRRTASLTQAVFVAIWERALVPLGKVLNRGVSQMAHLADKLRRKLWDDVLLPLARALGQAIAAAWPPLWAAWRFAEPWLVPAAVCVCAAQMLRQALPAAEAEAVAKAGPLPRLVFAGAGLSLSCVAAMASADAVVQSGEWLVRRGARSSGNAVRSAGFHIQILANFAYCHLDLYVITLLGEVAKQVLHGISGIARLVCRAIQALEAMLSVVARAVFELVEASLALLWRLLRRVLEPLLWVVRAIWSNPVLSLLCVALTLYGAQQIHSGRFAEPIEAFRSRASRLFAALLSAAASGQRLVAEHGPRAWACAVGSALRLRAAVEPLALGLAGELRSLSKMATSLTEHPWRILERPSFAAIVVVQQLVLSHIAFLLSDYAATLVPSATPLWLGRAGFKMAFGPLFVLGSLSELCAEGVLVVLQIAALPGFLLYTCTSMVVVLVEANRTRQAAARVVAPPAEGAAGIPRAGRDRAAEVRSWLQRLPAPEQRFEEDLCVICQEEEFAAEGGQRSVILPCGHGFHEDCIVQWLARPSSRPRCPMRCELSRTGASLQRAFL